MIFNRRKKMIDIGELQKQGKIRPPQETQTEIPTNKDGFIEINTQTKEKKSEVNFFGFMDEEDTNNKTNSEYYSKREIDSKIQKLDNLIYKLEQRIELIERKLHVNEF
ncbi:MAG: hypothetical protein WC260_01290 [Candidatus Pacearchaeota archaeon]